MTSASEGDITSSIGQALPYLRRYARALTGSQQMGDTYAATTLEAILADASVFDTALSPKVALLQVFHSIWSTSGGQFDDSEIGRAAKAQAHLSKLTKDTREALLLHTIEDLSIEEVAQVLRQGTDDAQALVNIAYEEMAKSLSGRVMIIEDEPIIAMDLEAIVTDLGHQVTGIARTASAAIELFDKDTPDLILSDIQLADNSSGVDAVREILSKAGPVPVIFITAFPERLLTGEGPEPAFLISKPYSEQQVRSAVSQAMFFSSTETLKA